jgi:hypothetical protein
VLFDIDIGGRYHPEIADFLLDGGVPVAFVTGNDYLVEPRHETVPVPTEAIHARAASHPLGKGSWVGITDRRNRSDHISMSIAGPLFPFSHRNGVRNSLTPLSIRGLIPAAAAWLKARVTQHGTLGWSTAYVF